MWLRLRRAPHLTLSPCSCLFAASGIVYTKAKLDMRSDQSKGGRPVQQVIVDSQSPTSRQR